MVITVWILGVVYSANGLILTESTLTCTSFEVTLADGETMAAKLVGEDTSMNVELLRVTRAAFRR